MCSIMQRGQVARMLKTLNESLALIENIRILSIRASVIGRAQVRLGF